MGAQIYEDVVTKKELQRLSTLITVIVAVVTLLAFWGGLYVLRYHVFKHYYNPQRDIIVKQDPETLEVYVWEEPDGLIYTRGNASVRYFPYGILGLILLLMVFAASLYQLLRVCAGRLLKRKTHGLPAK